MRGMRRHAQDAIAQFVLEAIHHRQHHDQHRNSQHQAGDRDQRDERR